MNAMSAHSDQKLDVVVDQQRDRSVVRVAGELDTTTAPDLRDRLQQLYDEGERKVVIDFEDIAFIDSTGLGVLVGALKRYRKGDGDLVLSSLGNGARRVFEVTGLIDVFTVVG
jgi:anti-sigma B factor antagonist